MELERELKGELERELKAGTFTGPLKFSLKLPLELPLQLNPLSIQTYCSQLTSQNSKTVKSHLSMTLMRVKLVLNKVKFKRRTWDARENFLLRLRPKTRT